MGYEKNKDMERKEARRGNGALGIGGKSGGAGKSQFGVEFVNIDLATGDVERIKQNMPDDAVVMAGIERLALDGYKVSISYDDKHSTFIASLTGSKECACVDNRGLCVTSRGPSMAAACAVALFKHHEVCEGGAWRAVSRTDEWG